jgi:RNA-directed DNA polymerase
VQEKRRRPGESRGHGKPETFNFLGFTHSCAKTRKGRFTVLRQTVRTRWQAKLRAVKTELRRRLHQPVPEQGAYLRAVVLGHNRYYGVPLNGPALHAFRAALVPLWWRVLRRRSQGNHLTWRRMSAYATRWLPTPRISHPYPRMRFAVITPRQEPDAVTPHVRICGGGDQRWSFPTPTFEPGHDHRSPRDDALLKQALAQIA